MRRSRPEDAGGKRSPSPRLRQPAPPPPPQPPPSEGSPSEAIVLDWGVLSATPSCCVCGEAYVPAPGEDGNSNSGDGHRNSSSPTPHTTRRWGGPRGPEESFVVLPDSTPVLSESYFSLSRNSGGSGVTHTTHEVSYTGAAGVAVAVRPGSRMPVSGSGYIVGGYAAPAGSEMLESGYGHGSGFAGWTGSGFGVGSSMLESIVQISHAGLSDNVRRESLLHVLSKRPARKAEAGGVADDGVGVAEARVSSGGTGEQLLIGVEEDPTLCCHCYASLLERIEEDSRLADREALAYRDFVELLDGIANDDLNSDTPQSRIGQGAGTAGELRTGGTLASETTVDDSASPKSAGSKDTQNRPTKDSMGRVDEAESPFAQALRTAERTSVQLRTELNSLESQRRALCERGSDAWAALSELAYARGVLGDECRELLQVSGEVAEKASDLSERSALSDLFLIRHLEGFPSINGYRLGRAPDDKRQLHWNEINAAWGEAILLVRCVSNAVDFHSRRFRLVPLNCASRVIELAKGDSAEERGGSDNMPVVFAHDLFSTCGRGDDKVRLLASIRAFLACASEVTTYVERRTLEKRLEGEMSAGAACVAWSDVGVPYKQTGDSVGGVAISSLKSQASWKAWLCQLVKNLEWTVEAASSLCVT